jgi:hypothetical protein
MIPATMKRNWVICSIAGVVLLSAIILKWVQREREPHYQGKAVSQWFEEITQEGIYALAWDSGYDRTNAPTKIPAVEAIVAMGRDAAPFLFEHIQFNLSPARLRMQDGFDWIKRRIGRRVEAINWENIKANYLLRRLGPQAEVVVPDLIVLANDHRNRFHDQALVLLGDLHLNSDQVIPLLEAELKGAKGAPAREGMLARALAKFGPASKTAIPTLVEFWRTAPFPAHRTTLAEAIRRIDPDAATKEKIE